MSGESATRWQAQAYRFGLRRIESAVSSGDPLLRGEQSRRRLNMSLIVSFVLAAVILGGFAVYGLVRPKPRIGSAAVVINGDSGGVYVSRDGRLYPAMNLSSALLAAGRGQSSAGRPRTTTVDTAAIGGQPRGPLLGIAGAPDVLPAVSKLVTSLWTVCDDTALPVGRPPAITTTAIIGDAPPPSGSLGRTGAILVSADQGATTFLIWGEHRSKITPDDDTVRLAFGFGSALRPRPISAALLNVIPESPDLLVPAISALGTAPAYAKVLGVQVGDVFALDSADRTTSVYVALSDGVQQITPLVGDLIRDQFDVVRGIPLVPPRLLREAPVTAHPIDLAAYPATRPKIISSGEHPVTCVARAGSSPSSTRVFALGAVPVPSGAKPVTVTQPGDLVADAVYLHPGSGAVFTSATQSQPSGDRARYLVTDDGVACPVVSDVALAHLGYSVQDVGRAAPELLSLLPKGPTLDPDEAAHFYPQTGVSAKSLPSVSSGGGSSGGGGP
jgi:type VII secretion protein EccB